MTDKLLERDEKLLNRLFDGQCGLISKWRAERLLRQRSVAQDYLDGLRAVRSEIDRSAKAGDFDAAGIDLSGRVDLWDRVSARIAAEEKAEIFLGKRFEKSPATSDSLTKRLQDSALRWGVSGIAVTATALLVIAFLPAQRGAGPIIGTPVANYSRSGLKAVDFSRAGLIPRATPAMSLINQQPAPERPRIIEERIPSSVEVDWMRSQGSVQVLPGSGNNSTILWVKKKRQIGPDMLANQHEMILQRPGVSSAPVILNDREVVPNEFQDAEN